MRMVWALQAQGKLHQAVELIAEHEAYIRQRGNRRYYISGVLNLMYGEILLEWNRLDEAEAQVRLGLRLLEDWPVPQSFCIGMGLLARLQLVMGDLAGARTTLQKVDELYHVEEFHPAFVQRFQIAQVCLWIVEQNVEALGTFVRKVSPLTTSDPAFRIEVPLVNLCRAWIALGRSDEALGLLKRLYAAAEGRAGSQITILTLLVAAQSDQPEKARVTLDEALRLAQTEGYLRSFLDAGEPMRRALDSWLQHSTSATPTSLRAYARCLLSALNYPNNTIREKTGAATVLPEPLTPRELDVLRLLVTGCSDRQIAEELILARGTVKYYVHGILQKLDVHSRTQAIARARELDLV
ncbi:MAG: LuxR C-terminal-related transcriptional regulator, partial [Acidobacteriaceae bacterium]